jgi:hypothetical protein
MKKSLTILAVAIAAIGAESHAANRSDAMSQQGHFPNSSSYTSLEISKDRFSGQEGTSSAVWASLKCAPIMLNGNSPSTRRVNHWSQTDADMELSPAAPDELDDVAVASHRAGTIEKFRKVDKKTTTSEKVVAKTWYETMREDAYLEVYVSGGGFRGGIDPVINDQLMISNSGLIQKFYESESTGIREYKKEVTREELFQLVKWIAENGFFEFAKEYNCADGDAACLQRLDQRPQPVPLKLVVAMGPYRNVISVPIFSLDQQNDFIKYPQNLRKIVKAIYDFASL